MFTERLKTARCEAKMTQQELGDMIGQTQNSIHSYVSGSRTPNVYVFCLLCAALGIEPEQMLSEEFKIAKESLML